MRIATTFQLRTAILSVLLAGAVGALIFTGCAEEPMAPKPLTNEQILTAIMTGDATAGSASSEWFDLAVTEGDDDGVSGSAPKPALFPPGEPAIDPSTWYRRLQWPFSHQVLPAVAGDSAYVQAATRMTGVLHIIGSYPVVDYPKKLTDIFSRRAIFRQYADSSEIAGGWRLEQISNFLVHSQPEPTVRIDSLALRVQPGGERVVIRDPLALMGPGDVLQFSTDDDVWCEVYTSGDPALVYLRAGQRVHQYPRIQMPETTSAGVFAGPWTIAGMPGLYQFRVDVLRHETLTEVDEATFPYNMTSWIVFYRVTLGSSGG